MSDQGPQGPEQAAQEPQGPPAGPERPAQQPLDHQGRRDERYRERFLQSEERFLQSEEKWARTEDENARLRGQLDGIRRSQAERAASQVLRDGRDLWLHAELSELLDQESGELDPAALQRSLDTIKAQRPDRVREHRVPDAGNLTATTEGPQSPKSWSDLLRPRGR